jgi:hypothetical protein
MKGEAPLRYALFLSKLHGFQLSYVKNWKGTLSKLWFCFMVTCFVIGVCTTFHAFAFYYTNIAYISESLVLCCNFVMCLVRLLTFVIRKDRLRILVDDLRKVTSESK